MSEIKINSKKLVECLKKKLARWKELHDNLGGNKPKDEVQYIRVGEEEFDEIAHFQNLMKDFITNGVFTKDDFNRICLEAGITTSISVRKIGWMSMSICPAKDPTVSFPL